MGDWITGMVVTLLVLMVLDGPISALLDRRPTLEEIAERLSAGADREVSQPSTERTTP